ncbi:phasin family protein [Hydrogenophaga bisanensis]|uniref:Phasin family protein n=1 Tax=Hydrogenophaga bisanensis TaxID=439611 RepID=A0ABW2R649_9BURK
MVKKIQKSTAAKKSAKSTATAAAGNGALSGAIRESAQQIWLAGLGAFSKAQEEGGKVFETLVKEGLTIQRKTQSVAEERINEATSRVSHMASDISSKAAGQWDKLETLFEERVAKALGKLGVPSARDIEGLLERIDSLTSQVQSLGGQPAPVRKTAKRPARAAAKTPVKAASSSAPKAAPRKAPARKVAKPA